MADTSLKYCKNAASLYSTVCRDPFFHTRFPEICCIAQIALIIKIIPASTAPHRKYEQVPVLDCGK